jgi:hypothetical protein
MLGAQENGMPRLARIIGLVGPLIAVTAPAAADDDAWRLRPQPETPLESGSNAPARLIDPAWTVQAEPSVWYVAPSGKVKLPVKSGSGPGSFTTEGDEVRLERLNLDSPRFEPTGELHLSFDRWRVTFSASTFDLERTATTADTSFRLGSVAVAAGDIFSTELELTTVEVTGGYRLWGRDFRAGSRHPEDAVDGVVRVYALAGARFYDLSFDFARAAGGSAGASEFFGEPIAGIRGEAVLAQDFTLDVQVSGGGFALSDSSSYSIDVLAGFQWRPTRHVGVQIGYRQLAYGLASDDGPDEFSYRGRLAGLYAGLVIRF